MSSAEDRRLAAQQRAEELVARIKSDKATRDSTPTRDKPMTSDTGIALNGAGPTTGGSVVEAKSVVSQTPDHLNLSITPERTPQMGTPGRDVASFLRASPPRQSPPRPRPVAPAAAASPVRTEAAASAIQMANAAIESARRVVATESSPSPDVVIRVPSPVLMSASSGGQASPPRPGTAEFVRYPAPGTGLSPGGISSSQSFGSSNKGGMANLDLRNNDDAFHVLANIVTDRLLPKVPAGMTSYSLDSSDRAFFDRMLPVAVRWSLVDALRFRRRHLPVDPGPDESTVATLTRKCCWLGLDRAEEENVLLQPDVATAEVGLVSFVSQGYQPPTIQNNRSVEREVGLSSSFQRSIDQQTGIDEAWQEQLFQEQQVRLQEQQQQSFQEQQQKVQQQLLYRQQLEIQQGQIQTQQDQINQLLDSNSSRGQQQSQVDDIDFAPYPQQPEAASNSLHAEPLLASEALDVSVASGASVQSRARQQVMAELKEATALMASSVTPEAANFWKAHVVDLQARLRALNGEPVPTESGPTGDYLLAEDATGTIDMAREFIDKNRSREKVTSHYAGSRETQAEYLERNRKMREREGGESGVMHAKVEHVPVVADASVVEPRMPSRKPSVRDEAKGYNGPPMVDVVAPADLPAGYTFEAQIGSKRFLATVPSGGVVRGDRFSCAMKDLDLVEIQVPTGNWRDELFDAFKFGFFHPLVLNTVFIPLIALGQIMTRNQLTWLGEQGNRLQSKSVSMNMMMVVLFWASMNSMALFHLAVNLNRGNLPTFVDYTALCVVNIAMITFTIYVVANTRASIRAKYDIPDDSCGGKDDAVCAMFCMPCTITQMGRHTADYGTYRAVCCSDTGLPRNVELVPAPSTGTPTYPSLDDDSHIA